VHRDKLYIADFGNHAIRVLDLNTFELATLAGDPQQEAFRPGPLRDGRPRDRERFAALPNPGHVAFDDQGHCLVATNQRGACIAELSLGGLLAPKAPAGEFQGRPHLDGVMMFPARRFLPPPWSPWPPPPWPPR